MFNKHVRASLLFQIIFCLTSCTSHTNTAIKRTADKIYSNEEQRVAAYTFQQFEPFMHANNDSTYVLNFWATWCAPCVAEIPYFQQLQAEFNHQKVAFIYVSLDFEKQIEKKLLPFLAKNKLKGEVIVLKQKGMSDWIGKIDSQWSGNLPATLIYNKNGSDFYPNSFEYDALRKALLKRMP